MFLHGPTESNSVEKPLLTFLSKKSAILDFISAKFFMGYSCVSPYILFYRAYAWSIYFALFLSCVNIAKLLIFKMAARPPFRKCLLPKVNQVIGRYSCAYLPNKKKTVLLETFFLKRANEHFFYSGHSN